MIRINLLGEKPDKTAACLVQGGLFCLVVVLTLAVCVGYNGQLGSDLELTQSRKVILDRQLAKLRIKTRKVEELEKNRKLLAEKLMTIARLKAKKQGPVRVLDDVTSAIPARAWLNEIVQKGELIEFTGIALDNQTVSRFMVTLDESVQFENVDLNYTRKFIQDGVNLQQFALKAKLADPLKRQKAQQQETEAALAANGKPESEQERPL